MFPQIHSGWEGLSSLYDLHDQYVLCDGKATKHISMMKMQENCKQ